MILNSFSYLLFAWRTKRSPSPSQISEIPWPEIVVNQESRFTVKTLPFSQNHFSLPYVHVSGIPGKTYTGTIFICRLQFKL